MQCRYQGGPSHDVSTTGPSPILTMANHGRPSSSRPDYDDDDEKEILLNEDLINAVRRNVAEEVKLDNIQQLLDKGANVDFKDGNHGNNTPLHVAARKGEVRVIELLLKNQADVNIRNSANATAFDVARKSDKATSKEIIDVLQQHCQNAVQESQQPKISPLQLDSCKFDDITERLFTFAEYFVHEFETKINFYHCVLEGILEKAGKLSDTFSGVIGQVGGGALGGVVGLLAGFPVEGASAGLKGGGLIAQMVGEFLGKQQYRIKTFHLLGVTEAYQKDRATFRRLLVDTACDIFQSFEMQFSSVTNDFGPKDALHNLAKDAVHRSFNHLVKESGSEVYLSDAVLLGSSKIESVWGLPMYRSELKTPGYDLEFDLHGLSLKWKSSSLFEKSGIMVCESVQSGMETYVKKLNPKARPEKYGYRRLLSTESWDKVRQHYVKDKGKATPWQFTRYQFSLQIEDLQKHGDRILKQIAKTDPLLMEKELRDMLTENKKVLIHLLTDLKTIGEADREVLKSIETSVQGVNLEECLNRIKALADENRNLHGKTHEKLDFLIELERNRAEASPGTSKSIWYNLISLSPTFTGRVEDLAALHNAFQVSHKTTVVISGLHGVGKSQLACKYAEEYYQDYYDDVLWIDASSEVAIARSFRCLLGDKILWKVKTQDGDDRSFRAVLEDVYDFFKNRRSLFIFDDASNYAAISEFLPTCLPQSVSKPFVLITSASKQWTRAPIDVFECILNPFSSQESGDFIRVALSVNGAKDHLQDVDIEELATTFSNLPLAIWQAVVYITYQKDKKQKWNQDFTVRDFLTLYKQKPMEVMTASCYAPKLTIFDVLEPTLKDIKDEYGGRAMRMLLVMAYFASANIPGEIFHKSLADGDNDLLESIIDTLEKYSLLQSQNGLMTIHSLIQDTIRLFLQKQGGSGWPSEKVVIRKGLNLLRDYLLSNSNDENTCAMHLVSLWNHAIQYNDLIETYIAENITKKRTHKVYVYLASAGHCPNIINRVLQHVSIKFPQHLHDVVHKKNFNEWISLHLAAQNGYIEVVKVLYHVGQVDINAQTNFQYTPLQLAAKEGHKNIVDFLLDKANVNLTTLYGFTPMHFAVVGNHVDIVQALATVSDLNVQTTKGNTALHVAAEKGYRDIYQILLDKGTDVSIKNNEGQTAAEILANYHPLTS